MKIPAFPQPFAPTGQDMNRSRPSAILFVNDSSMAGVCAWCEDKAEADAWCLDQGLDVTHTICLACRTRLADEENRVTCRRQVA